MTKTNYNVFYDGLVTNGIGISISHDSKSNESIMENFLISHGIDLDDIRREYDIITEELQSDAWGRVDPKNGIWTKQEEVDQYVHERGMIETIYNLLEDKKAKKPVFNLINEFIQVYNVSTDQNRITNPDKIGKINKGANPTFAKELNELVLN